jgi:hypothetical protein
VGGGELSCSKERFSWSLPWIGQGYVDLPVLYIKRAHKRRKKKDPVARSERAPRWFLTPNMIVPDWLLVMYVVVGTTLLYPYSRAADDGGYYHFTRFVTIELSGFFFFFLL